MAKKPVAWAAVRETIGFLGVIGSLLIVAYEVRQNTVAETASAIQESVAVAREQLLLLAQDSVLDAIEAKGDEGLEHLSPEERRRYQRTSLSFLWGMQGLFRQWKIGVLPDEDWGSWQHVICLNFEAPGLRELWLDGVRDAFTPSFVDYVESCTSFVGS